MKNKVCPTCRVEKAPEEFGRRSGRPHTLNSKCRLCQTFYKRQWARQHTETYRAYKYKIRYGITVAQYNQMLENQFGVCGICMSEPADNKKLVVDHNHHTGKVRGLLCDPCNLMVGFYERKPDIAENLETYLGI